MGDAPYIQDTNTTINHVLRNDYHHPVRAFSSLYEAFPSFFRNILINKNHQTQTSTCLIFNDSISLRAFAFTIYLAVVYILYPTYFSHLTVYIPRISHI